MDITNLPPLGITFYCPTPEDFKCVAEIRKRLEAAEIPSMWTTKEWHGERMTALDVYAHGNIVAKYL